MSGLSLLFKFKVKVACVLVFALLVFSLINVKLYLRKTEKTIANYRAITETYRNELVKLVREKQPANTKLLVSGELGKSSKLKALESRSFHVEQMCEKMSDSDKEEYKVPSYESYGNYWWDYPGGEGNDSPNAGMLQDDNYPRTIEKDPVTPAPVEKKEEPEVNKISYHNDFHEHGPSAIAPAYNFLVSVPEKCGSEFWFRIVEYLNFPQVSWPRDAIDKKHYQRKFLIPMVNSIDGASESIKDHGVSVAVVRHPFIRLYSAYHGFFTKDALTRDRKFAKWWLESSSAFRELLDDNEDIMENIATIGEDIEAKIDFMTFQQFLEGILIHLDSTEDSKYRRRWSESGEDHISPMYAILQPCHYPFKYYVKVENLSSESRDLFDAISIKLPDNYLMATHKSDTSDDSPQAKVKNYYRDISISTRRKLAQFYKIDFDFFQYSVDVKTLDITY